MIKKIRIEDLKPGMLVCGLARITGDASFFTNNILIKTGEDIEKLREEGFTYAYVDTELTQLSIPGHAKAAQERQVEDGAPHAPLPEAIDAEALNDAVGSAPLEKTGEEINPVEFSGEIKGARRIKEEAVKILKDVMQDVRLGKSIDNDAVNAAVDGILGSILRNIHAMASLARLKSYDEYTFTHSVNVCILCVALGAHMGLDRDSLHSLGVGSLLHDIGKMLLPQELVNKHGAYTQEEFELVQEHATKGMELIIGLDWAGDGVTNVVSEHHEKYDGSGYPLKLGADDIHVYARIAGLCDMYDAMTTDRVYRKRILPSEVLKFLYMSRDKYFGPGIVESFIKCLGIYPIGSLVELSTGELGLVKSVNEANLLQPQVLVVLDRHKRLYTNPVLADLAADDRRRITGIADTEDYTVDFEMFMQ